MRSTAQIREAAGDANRSMTGAAQESWFFNTLDQSEKRGAYWRLVVSTAQTWTSE
jgi:alkaline phosphatase D